MRLNLAVLDMIGTTVLAGGEVPSSFREAFRDVGIELSDEDIGQIRGRSKREAIQSLLTTHLPAFSPETGLVDSIYRRFQDALAAAFRTSVGPIPGAEEALRYLTDAGVEVVLTTGLDRGSAQLLFETLGWESLGLTGLVTGDDVLRGRPAPDLIYRAMGFAGVEDPQSVLVVGDTTADLEAAAAVGVAWSVGVLSGAHSREELETRPHSTLLHSVAGLPRWLEVVGALDVSRSSGGTSPDVRSQE